jgi:hypothetical protein
MLIKRFREKLKLDFGGNSVEVAHLGFPNFAKSVRMLARFVFEPFVFWLCQNEPANSSNR